MTGLIIALVLILLIMVVFGSYLIHFALSRAYFEKHNENAGKNPLSTMEEMDALSNESELVFIKSYDGTKLAGYYQENKNPSHLYFITMHGYHGLPREMATYAFHMRDKFGFNILVPTQRSHGLSEGKYITMGYKEKYDLQAWVNYIIEKDKDARIMLHGISMGGATVMQVSNLGLPKNVVAIVEDCGYTSSYDEFVHELKLYYHLPPWPLLHFTSLMSKHILGFHFKEADSLKAVSETEIPMLFIHGDADDFVPFRMLQPLYDAKKDKKDICVIKGAVHAKAQMTDPETYWNAVDNFTKKYFNL